MHEFILLMRKNDFPRVQNATRQKAFKELDASLGNSLSNRVSSLATKCMHRRGQLQMKDINPWLISSEKKGPYVAHYFVKENIDRNKVCFR